MAIRVPICIAGPSIHRPIRYMAPTTQVEMLSTEYHTRLEVYWAFIQVL